MKPILPGASLAGVLLAVLAGCGGGGGGDAPAAAAPPPAPGPGPTAGTSAVDDARAELTGLSLGEFFEKSYATLLARAPEDVVALTLEAVVPLDGTDLDPWSDSYRRETLAIADVVLELLLDFDRAALTPTEQVDVDVYRWYLEDRIAELDYFYFPFAATYSLISVHSRTERFFLDLHPLNSKADADAYVARMAQVQRKYGELVDYLNRQRDSGIVEPAITLRAAIDRIRPLAGGLATDHPWYREARDRLRAIPGLASADLVVLTQALESAVANSVIPAYSQLLATLAGLQAGAPGAIGVSQYTGGLDYYAYRLRHHTTTDLTAPEIHQLGLDELVRIHAEMRALFDQLGYPQNETLEQLFQRVASDGGTVAAVDVLPTYEAIVADAATRLTAVFDLAPMADVIVQPDPFGGFYIGPSFDGSRPGAFYAGTSRDEPRYLMRSLSYHEAVPGHHTQIALSMEQDAPTFRKIVRNTGFVEGWALYAERLASELGWYAGDPYGELGRLQYEALRAARLVVDTGIHYYGWSFGRAAEFNRENTGFSQSSSEGAAARYSVWPGQATGYMVGMLEILRLREKARMALGNDFNLTRFHRLLLAGGAVPLARLESIVDDWIAAGGP